MTRLVDVADELQIIINQFPIETLDTLVEEVYNLSYQLLFADKKLEDDLLRERDEAGLESLYTSQKCTEDDLELLQLFQEHVKSISHHQNKAKTLLQSWVDENNKTTSSNPVRKKKKSKPKNDVSFSIPDSAKEHILRGEIKYDTVKGFHHRQNGQDPPDRRTTELSKPNLSKIYRGWVAGYDPKRRGWVKKKVRSTFFPDHWTAEEVMEAVREAFMKPETINRKTGYWVGKGKNIAIEGYYNLRTGELATAFPVFGKRKG